MSEKFTNAYLWYLRRDGNVTGPFPVGQISSYILLGRVRDPDELSTDLTEWKKLSELPELVPSVMRDVTSQEALERLKLTYLHEDERLPGDRRQRRKIGDDARSAEPTSSRRGSDRRGPEPEDIQQHRAVHATLRQRFNTTIAKYSALPLLVIVVVAVTGWSWLLWFRPPPEKITAPDCASVSGPKVNWSYCNLANRTLAGANLAEANLDNAVLTGANLQDAVLPGANLSYANLDGANLHNAVLRGAQIKGAMLRKADLSRSLLENADMSYADLHGANLQGAALTGADLSRAIWTDGRVCAVGSVGSCL